jgi:hypothetical protein
MAVNPQRTSDGFGMNGQEAKQIFAVGAARSYRGVINVAVFAFGKPPMNSVAARRATMSNVDYKIT